MCDFLVSEIKTHHTFRILESIIDKDKHFIFSFQGFYSDLLSNRDLNMTIKDIERLDRIPFFCHNYFTEHNNYNIIYIKDIFQVYGLLDFDILLDALRKIIKRYAITTFTCIGDSAGGSMAILYGSLLNATKIIATSPQILLFKYLPNPNVFRELLIDKFNLFNFKFTNLSKLQPFTSNVIIARASFHGDISHTNMLDISDPKLEIKILSHKNIHSLTHILSKDDFINFYLSEIAKP